MKRNITLFLMLICLTFVGINVSAQSPAHHADKGHHTQQGHQAQPSHEETIKRGAALGGSPAVSLAKVLNAPKEFIDKPVLVEGVIRRVCQNKGCWMELSPSETAKGVRVTFKDYGFFVPTNSKGMKVKAEGKLGLKVLSKADADHLASEGAQFNRNADGTVDELSFVATGVELHK